MSVLRGDCVEVMAGMEPDSIDAIVTDPPYGLEFMGKEWDRPWAVTANASVGYAGRDDLRLPSHRDNRNANCRACGGRQRGAKTCRCAEPQWDRHPRQDMLDLQTWTHRWAAAALRVAKPGAYLLAFGGTRTVHRMTSALEDAGWVIRDMLVWAYAQGFPKSRASLKPAWEPIVLARKPGPLRHLNIDAARIASGEDNSRKPAVVGDTAAPFGKGYAMGGNGHDAGRWPANVILTAPIFDGGWDGVVGGGETGPMPGRYTRNVMPADGSWSDIYGNGKGIPTRETAEGYGDSGTYSRFFLLPKAPTRERVLSDGRRSPHPTQKPEALIRHLVTLVTPPDGVVLDPFLGSGTLGVVCEGLGVRWVGIEREAEYADWAESRIADRAPEWAVA